MSCSQLPLARLPITWYLATAGQVYPSPLLRTRPAHRHAGLPAPGGSFLELQLQGCRGGGSPRPRAGEWGCLSALRPEDRMQLALHTRAHASRSERGRSVSLTQPHRRLAL